MPEGTFPEHERLAKAAHDQLKELAGLTRKLLELLDAGDNETFAKVDREVEQALGEKERLIGRLRQHDEEHGCQQ